MSFLTKRERAESRPNPEKLKVILPPRRRSLRGVLTGRFRSFPAVLTLRTIRWNLAAQHRVYLQRTRSAVRERRWRRRSSQEQEVEQPHRVGYVDVVIAIGVGRCDAARSRSAGESPVEDAAGVGEVDRAVVVALAALEIHTGLRNCNPGRVEDSRSQAPHNPAVVVVELDPSPTVHEVRVKRLELERLWHLFARSPDADPQATPDDVELNDVIQRLIEWVRPELRPAPRGYPKNGVWLKPASNAQLDPDGGV